MTAGEERSAAQIERDLEAKRVELGATLEVLGERLDVKTRATQWAKETSERVRLQAKVLADERGPELRVAAGAAALVVVALITRRARSR